MDGAKNTTSQEGKCEKCGEGGNFKICKRPKMQMHTMWKTERPRRSVDGKNGEILGRWGSEL